MPIAVSVRYSMSHSDTHPKGSVWVRCCPIEEPAFFCLPLVPKSLSSPSLTRISQILFTPPNIS